MGGLSRKAIPYTPGGSPPQESGRGACNYGRGSPQSGGGGSAGNRDVRRAHGAHHRCARGEPYDAAPACDLSGGIYAGAQPGPPHQPEVQRRVLIEAPRQLEERHRPGSIVEKSFQGEPGSDPGWLKRY